MPELTRRWFLGGAISLLAAEATQLPSGIGAVARELKLGNKPAIRGDGRHNDGPGFGALLRKEPVLLPSEGIVIHGHGGCTIHSGRYAIGQEVYIPADAEFEIERAIFIGMELKPDEAFFCLDAKMLRKFTNNRSIRWDIMQGKPIILRAHEAWDRRGLGPITYVPRIKAADMQADSIHNSKTQFQKVELVKRDRLA